MAKKTEDLFDDEVTTGATLASGTTIGGNTAYHLGNDGQGSGLDVEKVDGEKPVTKGEKYSVSRNKVKGSEKNAYDIGSDDLRGIGFDETSNCVWVASNASIFELNQSATIQSQFATPSSNSYAKGLEVDDVVNTGSIWFMRGFDHILYNLDQAGTVLNKYTNPPGNGSETGVGIDSNGCLWIQAYNSSIYQANQNVSTIGGFQTNANTNSGVAVDSSDSIWHNDSGSELLIYKQDGTKVGTSGVQDNSWGITYDTDTGSLWVSGQLGSVWQNGSSKIITEINKL